MKIEIDKNYNFNEQEALIYEKWDKSGYFNPDNLSLVSNAPTYTIILPPPNITAKLHLGHSIMIAIEDLLIRYKRLQGYRTLWLPGTDHAAIATQNVVERKLLEEKKLRKYDLGKEKFLTEVWSFLNNTQSEILTQIKRMGASLDWSRLAFTLDEDRKRAVNQMFVDMYHEGIIYRGERIVNWCPRCRSTLADDEIEYKEEQTSLYWIKYGPFILATTRPETKLGDTGLAVNPKDERYYEFVGQTLEIDGVLGKFKVKIVADEAVEIDFGSGIIKVTPAHSFIDNEIAHRHGLDSIKIIDEDGKMKDNCGKYTGLSVLEARKEIVADMKKMGLIDRIDDNYIHNNAHCYRCDTVIEPLPSEQWFVAVDKKIPRLNNKSLKEAALEVALKDKITFTPNRFKKRYLDWMSNLHDWCISRQIWFGHSIPVWYKDGKIYCDIEAPKEQGWIQDPDTLDTWFSSGMWTFSTLGWPQNYKNKEKVGDLTKFHPSQVLETGYEIITLWVSRMIMMSLFALDEIPFSQVYLHGMILDKEGQKMSKSKGNGIDPIEMINKFSTDALRLSLLMGTTPGNDARFSEDKIAVKRNFINKLWNISRFILSNIEIDLEREDNKFKLQIDDLKTEADFWIIQNLHQTINLVDKHLELMNFSYAAEALNDFTWNQLADWYLEVAKVEKNKDKILSYILQNLLILWHPFIPFVTEVLWSKFNIGLLMVEQWPRVNQELEEAINKKESNFTLIQKIISSIRNARSSHKIEVNKKLKACIYTKDYQELLANNEDIIKNLKTHIDLIEFKESDEKLIDAIYLTESGVDIYLLGAVDKEKEKERLEKELNKTKNLISSQELKLSNEDFVQKAPEKLILNERKKLKDYQENYIKIKNLINEL